MAGASILDFQIFEISLADNVCKAQTHHRAKCRQNWSSCCGKIAFFEFSKWPPPPSWIFEIAKFYWLSGCRGSRRISMPNFVKIGQSVAKILRIFDFSRWRPPPSWIFGMVNFYMLTVSGGPGRINLPNFVKNSHSVEHCDFSNFQDGRRHHLRLIKSRNFIGYWGPEGRDASACQIWSKSVNRLRRFFDF